MSLNLILFLMAPFGYWIPVVAHTYVLICMALKRKLIKGESDLWVVNGARVAAVAIRTYALNLPSGFCLYLDN